MKRLDRMVALCVAASLLVACGDITRGQKIDHDRLTSFQPGVTTIAEVEQSLGPPLDVTKEPGGDSYLKYLYATERSSKYTRIPVVGDFLGHGHTVYNGDTVYVHFDAQGRLLDTQEYTQHFDTRHPSSAASTSTAVH